jgi:outer membrane protein OmpA-like peptidoglycan-associated protein
MRRVVIALTSVLLAAPLWASDPPQEKEKPKDEPKAGQAKGLAEELQVRQQAIQAKSQELGQKFREAKTEDERTKIRDEYFAFAGAQAKELLALVQKAPKDPMALQVLSFIVNSTRDEAVRGQAIEVISQHHLASDQIANVLQMVAETPSPAAEKLLRLAAEKAEKNNVRGLAVYGLAKQLQARAESSKSKDEAAKFSAEAERLYGEAAEKYADVPTFRGKIGEAAKGDLYVLKNLSVGKAAPEIEAEDLEGKKFKLSDYRGKVVLLDFWGNW